MVGARSVKLGFISPRGASSPHYDVFRALFPAGVEMDFVGMELAQGSLYELEGTMDMVVRRATELVAERGWEGVIASGAPLEVLNPDLPARLDAALEVPAVTAMSACVSALKAFDARRVLLMAPFDEPLLKGIREHLATVGIQAVSPAQLFDDYTGAFGIGPDQVFELAKKALEEAGSVDAIYFQGAPFNPIQVIQRLESELHTTVVASNPAMLWAVLSKLGLSYHIHGTGKLLDQWPKAA